MAGGGNSPSFLFADGRMNHLRQPVNVPHDERAVLALDKAKVSETQKLARHDLTFGADAARDLRLRRHRRYDGALALTRRAFCQAQEF